MASSMNSFHAHIASTVYRWRTIGLLSVQAAIHELLLPKRRFHQISSKLFCGAKCICVLGFDIRRAGQNIHEYGNCDAPDSSGVLLRQMLWFAAITERNASKFAICFPLTYSVPKEMTWLGLELEHLGWSSGEKQVHEVHNVSIQNIATWSWEQVFVFLVMWFTLDITCWWVGLTERFSSVPLASSWRLLRFHAGIRTICNLQMGSLAFSLRHVHLCTFR